MFCNDGNIFLIAYFKHFDFIEWFDLKNSNSNSLFERFSIKDFLVDSLVDSIT